MHIWVIEMLNDMSDKWEPCDDVSLTKAAAIEAVKDWQERNPSDYFRFRKYISAHDQHGEQFLAVGDYTISSYGDEDYWIGHKSGEGMSVFKFNFEKLIADYYASGF